VFGHLIDALLPLIMDHPIDKLDHPIDKLSLQGEEIYLLEGTLSSPYMNAETTRVLQKLKVEEANHYRYAGLFKLNNTPCPAWNKLFLWNVWDFVGIRIEGDVLTVEFHPNLEGEDSAFKDRMDLESNYAKAKELIQKTNSDFAAARESLLIQLREIAAQQEVRAREETERLREKAKVRAQIEKRFDELIL
jgi:hypothetical protein